MNETILPTSATLTRCVAGYIAVTLLLTATTFACHFRASMVAGLHRTVHAAGNISGRPLLHDVARSLTLDFLNAETDVPERLNVVWKGFWFLPETQAVRLSLGDGYSVTVWINGRRVLYRQPGEPARSGGRHVVTLPAGLHPLLVEYEGRAGNHHALGLFADDLAPYRFFRSSAAPADLWFAWAAVQTRAVAAVLWLTAAVVALPLVIAVCLRVAGKSKALCRMAAPGWYRSLAAAAQRRFGSGNSGTTSMHGGARLPVSGYSVDKRSLEMALRAALPFVFLVFLTDGVMHAVRSYYQRDSWIMGDWLINYQGGFVRRGLVGDVIHGLSGATAVNPGSYALLLQIMMYSILLAFLYLLLRQRDPLRYAPLVFLPFMFTYQGGFEGRKELIFLALMAVSVWLLQPGRGRRAELAFLTVLGLYPLVVLSHEILLGFLPYLLAAYFVSDRGARQKHATLVLSLACLSAFWFSIVLLYGLPKAGVAEQILQSLRLAGYPIGMGAITYLQVPVSAAYDYTAETFARFN